MKSLFTYVVLISYLVVSLSLGVLGLVMLHYEDRLDALQNMDDKEKSVVIYEGQEFDSLEALYIHLELEPMQSIAMWRTIEKYPAFLILVITSCSFGMLGSCIMVIRETALHGKELILREAIMFPILGMIAGLIVLAIAAIVPAILAEGSSTVRPPTLVFMSFFAGLFIREFYAWAEGRFQIIFKS